jgi:ATP-dependent RNA helicase RhlE
MRPRFNNRQNGRSRLAFGGNNRRRGPSVQSRYAIIDAIRAHSSRSDASGNTEVTEAPFQPVHTFADFAISDVLKRNIADKKYTSPTPVQDASIPSILEGRDLIGTANTGTGKTAAFLIPFIEKTSKDRTQRVLIVAPTRELAVQIDDEFRAFARGMGVRSALLIGGMSMGRQRFDLGARPQFVIGTPGRIKDMIENRILDLSQFHNVVLDEADRMVDIGFIADIKYFISLLPRERQSLFFSATISGKVSEILRIFVKNPVTVSMQKQDTAGNIHQEVIKTNPAMKKVDQLHDLLNQEGFDKVLLFGRTKWGIQKLTDELIDRGFKAGAIHGNKRQSQRHYVLEQFKRSEIQILLATDVASRGLDIPNVSHVINWELPESFDDYVHRIGRTGRADKKGIALTFID